MFYFIFFLALFFVPSLGFSADKAGAFKVSSSAINQAQEIDSKYTCQGADMSLPLSFSHVPLKAKSLAFTMHDTSAPEGIWVHWVVYNIPPGKVDINENTIPGHQALNDFGRYNYGGPCPADEKPHQYLIRAYALDDVLEINEGMTMYDLEKVIRGHILAKAELKGLYRKPVW